MVWGICRQFTNRLRVRTEHWQGSNLKTIHKAYLNVQEDKQTDDLSNNRPCSCFNRFYLHKYLLFHNKEFNSWNTAEALVGGQKEHGTNSTNSRTVGSIKNVIQMQLFCSVPCAGTHAHCGPGVWQRLTSHTGFPSKTCGCKFGATAKLTWFAQHFATRGQGWSVLWYSQKLENEFPIFFSLISWEFKNSLAARHMSDKRQGNLAVTLL